MVNLVGFSPGLLADWYGARNAQSLVRAGGVAANPAAGPGAAQPNAGVIPPWDAKAKPVGLEELARSVLADGKFFRPEEFKGLDGSKDAQALFTLHQGLKRLYALATEAADKSSNDIRRSFLERRFQEGMAQLETYFAQMGLKEVSLALGEARSVAESSVKIARGISEYVTGAIHQGDFDAEVDAFQGAAAFTITVTKHGADIPVQIDLDEMGATPRTLDNVASFINGKLEAEGIITRFSRARVGTPNEHGVYATSEFGFKISGVSTERITFSAAGSPTLYLAGISGTGEGAAGQLTRVGGLEGGAPETQFIRRIEADPVITTNAEGAESSAAAALRTKATVLGPNGELYVLAETDGAVNGVALKGESDLVLLKYDSTGRQVWSRVLGATEGASAGALAVTEDGSVVVTGAIKGALGTTIDKGGDDGFVAKFSATGTELWLERFGGPADEAPAAIALGANGEIFIGGSVRGAHIDGGRDGFVRAFDAGGKALWTRPVGGADAERVTSLAVAGDGGLLVGGMKNSESFLAKFDPVDGDGAALWTYNLGVMDGGELTALAVDGDAIYLTGSAGAASNLAGAHAGHAGGRDAFLIRLDDAPGAPEAAWTVFLGSENDDAARGIVVLDGAVYLAGRSNGDLPGGDAQPGERKSFAAKLDAGTGALAWTAQVSGRGGLSEAFALAIDPQGDSILDTLGLPRGTLDYGGGQLLAERTALRPGDHFYVSVDGGRKRKITIDAKDTYLSLTFKINAALVLDGKAQVGRSPQGDSLRIRPNGGAVIELFAGANGQDALSALGLAPGAVQNKPDPKAVSKGLASAAPPLYALGLPTTLGIGTGAVAGTAAEALDKAMAAIRRAWREMNTNPALNDLLNRQQMGPPPAHLTAQLANFQAGLDRLNAGDGGGFLI